MMYTFKYQKKHSFAKRKAESASVIIKYPNRIPIICESATNEINLDKSKFITSDDLTFGQFLYVIRKRAKIKHEKAIYLLTERNNAPPQHMYMVNVYNEYVNEDGFLYIVVNGDTAFG